jgi:hypothetical protein
VSAIVSVRVFKSYHSRFVAAWTQDQ